MIASGLADVVLIVHFAFILFALIGGLMVLRWRWVAWPHLAAMFWATAVELGGWICPLTPLENMLRARAGQAGIGGGFVEHYLAPVIYPAAMPRTLALAAGITVLVWNGLVYAWVIRRLRGRVRRTLPL